MAEGCSVETATFSPIALPIDGSQKRTRLVRSPVPEVVVHHSNENDTTQIVQILKDAKHGRTSPSTGRVSVDISGTSGGGRRNIASPSSFALKSLPSLASAAATTATTIMRELPVPLKAEDFERLCFASQLTVETPLVDSLPNERPDVCQALSASLATFSGEEEQQLGYWNDIFVNMARIFLPPEWLYWWMDIHYPLPKFPKKKPEQHPFALVLKGYAASQQYKYYLDRERWLRWDPYGTENPDVTCVEDEWTLDTFEGYVLTVLVELNKRTIEKRVWTTQILPLIAMVEPSLELFELWLNLYIQMIPEHKREELTRHAVLVTVFNGKTLLQYAQEAENIPLTLLLLNPPPQFNDDQQEEENTTTTNSLLATQTEWLVTNTQHDFRSTPLAKWFKVFVRAQEWLDDHFVGLDHMPLPLAYIQPAKTQQQIEYRYKQYRRTDIKAVLVRMLTLLEQLLTDEQAEKIFGSKDVSYITLLQETNPDKYNIIHEAIMKFFEAQDRCSENGQGDEENDDDDDDSAATDDDDDEEFDVENLDLE